MFTATDLVFNGYNFKNDLYVEEVRRKLTGSISHNVIKIPKRTGYLHRSAEIGEKEILVAVRLIQSSRLAVMDKVHHIAGKLYSEKPAKLVTRGDNLYDMAILSGETDIEQLLYTGRADLLFINYEGLQYGNRVLQSITSGAAQTIQGTYKTRAIIKITLTAAAASGFTLSNTTTGKSIKLNGSFASGNVLTFNLENESVMLGTNLIMAQVDYNITRFFDLVPGNNTLTWTNGTATLDYSPRYL